MALIDITPVMTSNNAPSPYIVGASSIYSDTFPAWKAFSGTTIDSNDAWLASGTTGAIILDFGVETSIKAFGIVGRSETSGYSTTAPKTFVLYGSNTSSTNGFEVLYKGTNEILWNSTESRMFRLDNTYSYRYYKLTIIENNGHAQATGLGLLKFYQDDGVTPTINSTYQTQRRALPYGTRARLESLTYELPNMLAVENDGDNEGTLRVTNHAGKFKVAKAGQKVRKLWNGVATTTTALTLEDMIENYSSIVLVANYSTGSGVIEGKTTQTYPVAESEFYDNEFLITLSLYSSSSAKAPYIYFKMKGNELTITAIGAGGFTQSPRLISVYGIY